MEPVCVDLSQLLEIAAKNDSSVRYRSALALPLSKTETTSFSFSTTQGLQTLWSEIIAEHQSGQSFWTAFSRPIVDNLRRAATSLHIFDNVTRNIMTQGAAAERGINKDDKKGRRKGKGKNGKDGKNAVNENRSVSGPGTCVDPSAEQGAGGFQAATVRFVKSRGRFEIFGGSLSDAERAAKSLARRILRLSKPEATLCYVPEVKRYTKSFVARLCAVVNELRAYSSDVRFVIRIGNVVNAPSFEDVPEDRDLDENSRLRANTEEDAHHQVQHRTSFLLSHTQHLLVLPQHVDVPGEDLFLAQAQQQFLQRSSATGISEFERLSQRFVGGAERLSSSTTLQEREKIVIAVQTAQAPKILHEVVKALDSGVLMQMKNRENSIRSSNKKNSSTSKTKTNVGKRCVMCHRGTSSTGGRDHNQTSAVQTVTRPQGFQLTLCGCTFCRECFRHSILRSTAETEKAHCELCSSPILASDCRNIIQPWWNAASDTERARFDREWEQIGNRIVERCAQEMTADAGAASSSIAGGSRATSSSGVPDRDMLTCPDCATTNVFNTKMMSSSSIYTPSRTRSSSSSFSSNFTSSTKGQQSCKEKGPSKGKAKGQGKKGHTNSAGGDHNVTTNFVRCRNFRGNCSNYLCVTCGQVVHTHEQYSICRSKQCLVASQ
ncbi:unnamed protein product [Amoebophrya sp. A25]|nr:unnamed protein product [Amoebophrya sp. A25]|eukprot:GSA25T00003076001.1